MAAEIRSKRPNAKVETHGESDKLGMFDVVADGRKLWSKHETGEFPKPEAIVAQIPEPPAA